MSAPKRPKLDPAIRAQAARLRRELPAVVEALEEAAVRREQRRARAAVLKVPSEIGYRLYGDEYDTGLVPIHDVLDAIEPKRKPR
jgi:hypothetical protein